MTEPCVKQGQFFWPEREHYGPSPLSYWQVVKIYNLGFYYPALKPLPSVFSVTHPPYPEMSALEG